MDELLHKYYHLYIKIVQKQLLAQLKKSSPKIEKTKKKLYFSKKEQQCLFALTISLIHIDTQIQLNSQYSLGTNTLRINYEFIENEKIMVTVNYYSYEFPYILYNIDYIQSLIKNNQIGEIDLYLIYQWHFTTIQYQSNKLFIKIYYPHQGKYIEYKDDTVRQFSYAQFSLLFGESQNFKQSDGQVNQFKFKNCYEEFMDNYQCHYSCATCNGPLRNNCLSCPINSNREYEPEHNTCICQLWTQEQNQANCFYIQDITQMSVEYIKNINISELQNFDQIEPSIVCSYGYFLYEEDCYQWIVHHPLKVEIQYVEIAQIIGKTGLRILFVKNMYQVEQIMISKK